ncbi:carboxypeptidase regulatory-like domain-containing protein [Thalassoglobus sp. JC818]|uniref:carboxypeptidase regulatory-like domain-containing protein n=1 Tax=Thalassoglobus sp. JC818 TaxID=3232136 RepID=UPI003459D906
MPMRILLCLMLIAPLAGCGGSDNDLQRVTGKVTLDGQPLPDAFVVFAPKEGGTTSYGKTDSQGVYEMMFSDDEKGAWVGVNVVKISTGDVGSGNSAGAKEKVPAVYNMSSTLTADVAATGSNEFNFDLKSDAGRIVEADLAREADDSQ